MSDAIFCHYTTEFMQLEGLYDTYGRIISQSGNIENPYTYTGREFDAESGLYYYRARYYDPSVGRFVTSDPIGLEGGINTYSYASNNPISLFDPFGLRVYPADFIGPPQPGDCYSPIPITPPGADVDANMEEAAKHSNPWWFKNQVRNKGPWDYKQQGRQYQNFGNFNYGATGMAFGFSETTLLREAGRAQQAAGTSRPEWGDPGSRFNPWGGTPPYGDAPDDQYWIKRGTEYFPNGGRTECPCE